MTLQAKYGAKRGRKPREPIAPLASGFIDTRTRRPRLTNAAAWRREIRYVYRQALEGRLDTLDASRLTYIATEGADREMQAELAERLSELANRVARLEGTSVYETPLLTHQEGAGATIEGEVLPNSGVGV